MQLNNPIIDKPTAEEQPYKSLGAVLPVDLLSFAYQIASGMVRERVEEREREIEEGE